jgi:small GTP-binding protein
MESIKEYDHLYKIVLIGNSNVGKTNLISRFSRDEFDIHSHSTIGIEFSTRTIRIQDKIVKAQIWDTAGQERFRSISKSYYRGSDGGFIVFDITNRESFENITKWYSEIITYSKPNVKIFLIGNKMDLENRRVVTKEEASEYARSYKMTYVETSAFTPNNVNKIFIDLFTEIHDQRFTELMDKKKIDDEEEHKMIAESEKVIPISEEIIKFNGCRC